MDSLECGRDLELEIVARILAKVAFDHGQIAIEVHVPFVNRFFIGDAALTQLLRGSSPLACPDQPPRMPQSSIEQLADLLEASMVVVISAS